MISMELPIYYGGREYRAFLQSGFFDDRKTAKVFHNHSMAEIHLVIGGTLEYRIGNEIVTLTKDSIMLIPENVFHGAVCVDENVRHIAFQFAMNNCCFNTVKLPDGTLERVWENVRSGVEKNCGNKLSATLSYLVSELINDGNGCRIIPVREREIIIREYVSRHYADGCDIGQLSKELNLSEKQTERVLKRVFGKPFGQIITERRMEIAGQLIATNNYTLSQVAELVGYKTYSGFWKAYKK